METYPRVIAALHHHRHNDPHVHKRGTSGAHGHRRRRPRCLLAGPRPHAKRHRRGCRARAAHAAARDFREVGLEVDLWQLDLDALRADPRFPGTEAPRTEGYGVVGVTPGEGPPALALERSIADACTHDPWLRDHPVEVTWSGGQFGPGNIDADHPLIRQTSDAVAAITGRGAPTRAAAPYGSDLRLYAGIGGIPTLHYGPGDVRYAHAPREQVAIREVLESARALALLAARRCGARQ